MSETPFDKDNLSELSKLKWLPENNGSFSENREHVQRFITLYLGTDGLFLLQLIAQHADVVFTTELIAVLFKTYIEIEAQRA